MWLHARNLKIPFLRCFSKWYTGLPVYGSVHGHKLCIKKEKKKRGGVNITQANSLKILISSLRACAGFFSLILARFSLLKHTSYTLRRFWPTTVNQAFFKFSLAELWRGCENYFHIMTSFFCATFSLKLTGETAQMHLCNKHRLRKKTLRKKNLLLSRKAQLRYIT